MCPVVAITDIKIADDFEQPGILFQAIFTIEITYGQRRGNHFFRISNTAFLHGSGKFFTVVNNVLHTGEIIQQHHTVGVFNGLPGEQFVVLQIHHRFDDMFAVEHNDVGFARLVNRFVFQRKRPDSLFIWR